MRAILLVLALVFAAAPALARAPDVVLKGVVTGADNLGYRELPFVVPQGVGRITVTFAYTGHEQHTALDLGLFDPERFRGWSGGDKPGFTLSDTDATPSYLPGPIPAGTWTLILGIPNFARCDLELRSRRLLRQAGRRARGLCILRCASARRPGVVSR